jgi:hypothetical protein
LLALALSAVDVTGASAAMTRTPHRSATMHAATHRAKTRRVCRHQGRRVVCRGVTTKPRRPATSAKSKSTTTTTRKK